jgi:hypothetical protein
LDIATIVSALKAQRIQIDGAIKVLEGLSSNGATSSSAPKSAAVQTPKRGGLTAAGRKRLSDMMKKRWAERRKKASAKK